MGIVYLAGFVVGIVGDIMIKSVLDAPNHLSTISASTMTVAFSAIIWLLAVVGDAGHGVLMFPVLKQDSERMDIGYLAFRIVDADSIICLRIGSAINKEPIPVLETPNKLHNSDISSTLRRSDRLRPRNQIWSLAHTSRRARFLERRHRNRRQWVPDKAPTHSITT